MKSLRVRDEFCKHRSWTLGGLEAVAITGHTRHRHTPSPVVPALRHRALPPDLSFGPTALAAAIARTATLRNAPVELLSRWRDSAPAGSRTYDRERGAFSLSSHFGFLADVERTVFAARVGAGITDIAMNSLGYTWRDNADCLSVSLDPRADFIYAGVTHRDMVSSWLRHTLILAEH